MIDVYKGSAVIVQARLNSSRLYRKALMDLNGKSILHHVLTAMRELPVEHFILACDTNSKAEFQAIANLLGFICIDGPEDDVLQRFCLAIEAVNNEANKSPIKTIVRATADNPFLFVPAAISSLERYYELDEPDYFTMTGLPHGSGVEVIKASALLKANKESANKYEREHVGPALYSHAAIYNCVREAAPSEWYYPDFRTTVDTPVDYENANQMTKFLKRKNKTEPYDPLDIIDAYNYANRLVLFSPSVIPGQGSGHLHRVCDMVLSLADRLNCLIYIPKQDKPHFSKQILSRIPFDMIVEEIPDNTALIVLDRFRTDKNEIVKFKKIAPVVTIDDGGSGRDFADFILDILPSLNDEENKAFLEDDSVIKKAFNISSPRFIPLPENRKKVVKDVYGKNNKKLVLKPEETKVLVVCGGENSYRMALPIANTLASLRFSVSAIDVNLNFQDIKKYDGRFQAYAQIENLREKLHEWDLVVTHYGFTAFEALAAGCSVLLVSPTAYHHELGLAAGFTSLPEGIPSASDFAKEFHAGIKVPQIITPFSEQEDLAECLHNLSYGKKYPCPFCGNDAEYEIIARTTDRTVGRCLKCKMLFLSFIVSPPKKYTEQYFFDEYKAQYGKTYLEDFEAIKQQGMRRMEIIDKFYQDIFYKKKEYNIFNDEKKILDIGCAYGPFVSAAKDTGWRAVGTDISESAVNYVKDTLKIPAFTSAFPALPESFDFIYQKALTGSGYEKISVPLEHGSFSAVSMWFVIEHFQDLDSVVRRANDLLMPGGVFAFSTPNVAGVTGRFFPQKFFRISPTDHYSLWDSRTASAQLEKYGFKVLKIVSIGHHPERFKLLFPIKRRGLRWHFYMMISKFFGLGDSMEIYAMKRGSMQDVD